MLRAHRCVRCGDPMPIGRRVDRRYCRASCRTSAYRERRREATQRPLRRGRSPEPDQPLPPELVLSLRQVPPAVLTALAGWFGEHASSDQLVAARQRVAELEQQVQRARAELTAQREETSAQRAQDRQAREAGWRQRAEAANQQLAELNGSLLSLRNQEAEQAEALQQERAVLAYTRQAAEQQTVEHAHQMRQAIGSMESAQAEARSLRQQLHTAQLRCDELQTSWRQPRPKPESRSRNAIGPRTSRGERLPSGAKSSSRSVSLGHRPRSPHTRPLPMKWLASLTAAKKRWPR